MLDGAVTDVGGEVAEFDGGESVVGEAVVAETADVVGGVVVVVAADVAVVVGADSLPAEHDVKAAIATIIGTRRPPITPRLLEGPGERTEHEQDYLRPPVFWA